MNINLKRRTCLLMFFVLSLTLVFPSPASTAGRAPFSAENQDIIYVSPGGTALMDAINAIPQGGVIELSGGTYTSPNNPGWKIDNKNKEFTIRAAPGATVILSGEGSRSIVRIHNPTFPYEKPIIFENIIFKDGYQGQDGLGAGVSLFRGYVKFINCRFENNNGNQPNIGGGAFLAHLGSVAHFYNTRFENNRAKNYGAAMSLQHDSSVHIFDSEFRNNRVNYAYHSPFAAGGAIHSGNSHVNVYNSIFDGNQAGYVGGAIYAIGEYAEPLNVSRANVTVQQSIFTNNHARHDSTVSTYSPTEAGAIHIENQSVATINLSVFIGNSAEIGGGMNTYRGKIYVSNSQLFGNWATGLGSGTGFGGAVAATSLDGVDISTGYGKYNRPPAELHLDQVLIVGRYGSTTTVGQAGGGLYAAGDLWRVDGASQPIPDMGTVEENRAIVRLNNVLFADLDVQETAARHPGTGAGGAVSVDLADLQMNNVMIIDSDAIGPDGQGGAVMAMNRSLARITNSTFANNTSGKMGGALQVVGAEIYMSNSRLIENSVDGYTYGAAIFTAPMGNFPVTGLIENSIISDNKGIAVFDDDRVNGPNNEVRYNNNQFFQNIYSEGYVYKSSIAGTHTAESLNALVVTRNNGTSTDKSTIDNKRLTSLPSVGHMLAVPSYLVAGSGFDSTHMGFAWSGKNAALNGETLTSTTGWMDNIQAGVYGLKVESTMILLEIHELQPRLYLPMLGR